MSLPLLLAGFLGGGLSLLEIFNSTRKPPAWRAAPWILALFSFDGFSSCLVYGLLGEALKGLTWFTGAWPMLLAGLCGPALLRSQLALLGSGQEENYVGPAQRYRKLRQRLEVAIDEEGAAAQGNWVATKALPAIVHISILELRQQIVNSVKALDKITEIRRAEITSFCTDTLNDNVVTEDDRRH